MDAYMIPHYADTPKAMRHTLKVVRDLPARDRVQVVRNWDEIQEGIFQGKRFPAQEFAKYLEAKAAGKAMNNEQ
jgi:hypothetical protein